MTSSTQKYLYIAAGPNGAGKSTFARAFLKDKDYVFINTDDIARELCPGAMETAKLSAGRIFFERLLYNISLEKNILIESTLSGHHIERLMPRFRNEGYKVLIIFVYLDHPRICIERIKERVLKGGHHVPDVDVIRRFYRSKRNFWTIYRFIADNWLMFYNSDNSFQDVALGIHDDYSVSNNQFFELFMHDI